MTNFFAIILSIIFIINNYITIASTLHTTIIINVDKGIALQQIGVYSDKLEESIFHIFVPYNNLCIDSPNTDVCEYVKSTDPDIVEIGTLIPHSNRMSTINNRENISYTIQKDIRRIFSFHKIDKFISKSKSIVYFIDNEFYVTRNAAESTKMISPFSANINQTTLIRHATNPATLVLEQVFNNKVGYDFLSDEHIKEILPLTMSTTFGTIDHKNIKENLNMFTDMIVGQTVYALKSCSMRSNEDSRYGPACLVVSTIFRRLPVGSSSFYNVYRLTPLPVFFQGETYVYSDLPKIFGFNAIDKKVILWNDDNLLAACTFSRLVHCRGYPLNIPLSTLPCLDELFSVESVSMSKCQVIKSKSILPKILNIYHNIWYVYGSEESFECELQSVASSISDVILINQPMIVTLPCGRSVRCSNVQLPPTQCVNTTIILTGKVNNTRSKRSVSTIVFNNITNRLVSFYKSAAKHALMELQTDTDIDQGGPRKIFQQFGNILLSSLCFILISIVLLVFKVIKIKITKQVDKIQTEVNRIQRDMTRIL